MYNPKIAIIDSGIDVSNVSLRKCIIKCYGFKESLDDNKIIETYEYDDCYGHGTNCLDLIYTLCPSSRFYPIKIVNEHGKTNMRLLLAALYKCLELPVDLICASLSYTQLSENDELNDVCNSIRKQGKVLCVSESNKIKQSIPAKYNSVLGVGGLNQNSESEIKIYKDSVIQVMANISPVFVAGKSGRFNFFKGTSKANAYVCGMLARTINKKLDVDLDEALLRLEKISNYKEKKFHTDLHIGELQNDDEGIDILKVVIRELYKLGCCSELKTIAKFPFISSVTGITFFNFFDFITEIYKYYDIHQVDFHQIHIDNVCTIYNLVEYIRRMIHNEKQKCTI